MKQPISAIEAMAQAKRLVIKVGSALLMASDGTVNARWLSCLVTDIARLRAQGKQVIVVSSGAIAIGRNRLSFAPARHSSGHSSVHNPGRSPGHSPELRLEEKQAAAAVGQALLIRRYDDAFAPHGMVAAQLLLTLSITEDRRRYLNARATVEALLSAGAVPIINENDTVATGEIRYGDNDRLAAHTAQMAGADLLILLSDIDGLYTKNPHHHQDAVPIPLVTLITPEIEACAGGNTPAGVGSGGMQTKLAAAKLAGAAGCTTLIASGLLGHTPTSHGLVARRPVAANPVASQPGTSQPGTSQPGTSQPGTSQPGADGLTAGEPVAGELVEQGIPGIAGPIARITEGARTTLFLPQHTKENARRQWIAGKLSAEGRLVIDAGAERALRAGSSLLAVGVTAVHGAFVRGDTVYIENTAGQALAQGIAAYGADEITLIKGLRSDDIEQALGYKRRPAIIHRDDLVILGDTR